MALPELLPAGGPLLLLILLGGWTALDATGYGQFMISRPLVASALAGWIVGDPMAGAALGLVLEAFQLTVLPVGASRYPEPGPAAVAAGALFSAHMVSMSALLTAVAFYLAWERLGGATVHLQRKANSRLFDVADGDPISPARLSAGHRLAVLLDLLRGMLLVAVGLLLLSTVMAAVRQVWGIGERIPELVVSAALAALLTSSLRLFGDRTRLFAVGVAVGLLVLLIQR